MSVYEWYTCPLCRRKVSRERGEKDEHDCPILTERKVKVEGADDE